MGTFLNMDINNNKLKYDVEKNLLDNILKNNIDLENPCNGKGTCGKCKIKLISGDFNELDLSERKFLSDREIEEGIRIACMTYGKSDIKINSVSSNNNYKALETGYIAEFSKKPLISKKVIKFSKPNIENQIDYESLICKSFNIKNIPVSILKDFNINDLITGVFYDNELIAIESGDTKNALYGLAIDLGTTTLVITLVDILTGKEIATKSMINPQKKYGLDVLTRITYELQNQENGLKELQSEIIQGINKLILELSKQENINKDNIYDITIAGNTTMLHLLLGISAESIGKSPYVPLFIKSKNIKADFLGINVSKSARLYCLPSVSAYIGSDIVAGIYSSGLKNMKGNILFIDIGTNGEIVLKKNDEIITCSCAAGPALEGMNISSGMRATEGAIESFKINENGIKYKTIENKEAVGICGSGILSITNELLKSGILKKNGTFIKKEDLDINDYRYSMIGLNGKKRELIISKDIKVTQDDIRQVQLAKGAILSGFYALLDRADIDINELDEILIAGQFGKHITPDDLIGVDLLPKEAKSKISYLGNSSKAGAYMSLMSKDIRLEMESLANNIKYIELASSKNYERLFANSLRFNV